MAVDVQALRKRIDQAEMNQETVANEIGMNRSSFYRKMRNRGVGFRIDEVQKMSVVLNLTPDEVRDIFFGK